VTDYATQAGVYRGALLLGLARGEEIVGWADSAIGGDPKAPPELVEISTTPPENITALRQRLFDIGGEGNSPLVVRRIIGLVHRDLASGRRGFADTMTVLRQLRAFLKLDRDLNEHVKALGVDVALGRDGAEARVRDWLQSFA
jgi:hypothetical protein